MSFFILHPSSFILLFLLSCSAHPGREVYTRSGCPQCHGPDRAGTDKGPPLESLRYVWTPETLRGYLDKPSVYVEKDPRLQALKQQYRTVMPQFAIEEEDRRQLIAYLLAEE